MRPRAAELFRCGMLLGATPSAHGQLSGSLPASTEGGDFDPVAGFAFGSESPHAEDPPKVAVPVVAVGSVVDPVWPDSLVARWADVAGMREDGAGKDGRRRWTHVALQDVEHMKVMNHAETMRAAFQEVGVAAVAAATRAVDVS